MTILFLIFYHEKFLTEIKRKKEKQTEDITYHRGISKRQYNNFEIFLKVARIYFAQCLLKLSSLSYKLDENFGYSKTL